MRLEILYKTLTKLISVENQERKLNEEYLARSKCPTFKTENRLLQLRSLH
jgi:hypothetical protein